MLPNTYLLTSPMGLEQALGKEILSSDLIKGLRKINPRLNVPDPSVFTWYPLQAKGHTSLWLGEPFKGRKITVFRLGAIPEFTRLDAKGLIIERGWRAIFDKVIKSRGASKRQLERTFKINLDKATKGDASCPKCRREGKITPANGGKGGLCAQHDRLMTGVRASQQAQRDAPHYARDISNYISRAPVSVALKTTDKRRVR